MKNIEFIGLLAAVLTTSALAPQIIKSYKSKKTDDISLLMYSVMGIGIILWLIYGSLIRNTPLIIGNGVSLTFALAMFYLKLRYGRK